MGVKIIGEVIDDLAKINGADIITAGDAVVGEVKTGSTFYAGSSTLLTGNGTQTLNAANDTVNAGYYAATTLHDVDADLAEANIADGVEIFGITGILVAGAIVHDDQDKDVDSQATSLARTIHCEVSPNVPVGGDTTLFTVTITCAQATVVQVAYIVSANEHTEPNGIKLQMYIDGVAQGETGFLPNDNEFHIYSDMGNKAVSSGDRIVYLNAHNYSGTQYALYITGGIYAGCTKL